MSNNVTVSYQNYIDGKWVDSASKREYPITNPAHKTQVIGNFQLSDIEDTDNAVESASKASALGLIHQHLVGGRSSTNL
ncbi:MAG: hypothetical protein CM1200mP15_14890 [Dehalococcoidia bacterium]|nr:MAG: hypothetical protein CM1200mP15_14890 [Dehalococcoidia bacterium]